MVKNRKRQLKNDAHIPSSGQNRGSSLAPCLWREERRKEEPLRRRPWRRDRLARWRSFCEARRKRSIEQSGVGFHRHWRAKRIANTWHRQHIAWAAWFWLHFLAQVAN